MEENSLLLSTRMNSSEEVSLNHDHYENYNGIASNNHDHHNEGNFSSPSSEANINGDEKFISVDDAIEWMGFVFF